MGEHVDSVSSVHGCSDRLRVPSSHHRDEHIDVKQPVFEHETRKINKIVSDKAAYVALPRFFSKFPSRLAPILHFAGLSNLISSSDPFL